MFSLDAKGKQLLICGIVLSLFIISVAASYVQTPGEHEFQFHRKRYEQIVAKVKSMKMDKGYDEFEFGHLYVSSSLDPSTLNRKPVNKDNMEGMIEAFHDKASGIYTIVIITQDRGHLGTFGYYFSDTPNQFPGDGRTWQATSQINPHWWIAENTNW